MPYFKKQQLQDHEINSINAWRVGGRKLAVKKDYDFKSGTRGGVEALHIRLPTLQQVFYKHYAKK